MKILYSPWRSKYIKEKDTKFEHECPFCKSINENRDAENYIIKRFEHSFLILNLYPYNAGHLMAIPNRHVANLYDLTKEELSELMDITSQATRVWNDLKSEGINIGMNLGKIAGAGIPNHLHMHILPRWQGDTNFMPLIAGTKTVAFDLNDIYENLKKHF